MNYQAVLLAIAEDLTETTVCSIETDDGEQLAKLMATIRVTNMTLVPAPGHRWAITYT
jgi:hypothetical protein